MTQYSDQVKSVVAFEKITLKNIYGEVIANLGMHQLRIAETEKCSGGSADVQYSGFFSGGMENSGIRIHRKTVHEAGYHENGRAIPKRVGKWR